MPGDRIRLSRSIVFRGILLGLILGLFGLTQTSFAATPDVSTDKADYAPGETVVITGTGFGSSASLTVRVTALMCSIGIVACFSVWTANDW